MKNVGLLCLALLLTCTFKAQAITSQPVRQTPGNTGTSQPAPKMNAQQKSAAETCKTYVSYRLGSLMSLNIEQVSTPRPPSNLWIVVGEDKSRTPAISFICHLQQKDQRWELKKLELLQLEKTQ